MPQIMSSEAINSFAQQGLVELINRIQHWAPDMTMVGKSQLAAPIKSAGVVLSQPTNSTTPSSGLARMDSLDKINALGSNFIFENNRYFSFFSKISFYITWRFPNSN
jgi:hypothetical protein